MRFKCTLETLRNCTESSPHSFSFPFARDAFSSFDRAPHSTQPLPLPPHARLNVSVQHGVNGKIRKPERISDAYLLPRFTSRPRERTLLLERRRERERERKSLLRNETSGRGRGKIFEKTSPFRQQVVIECSSIVVLVVKVLAPDSFPVKSRSPGEIFNKKKKYITDNEIKS